MTSVLYNIDMSPLTVGPREYKRLVRPDTCPNYRLTDHDYAYLEYIDRFHFLSSAQVAKGHPASPVVIARRLRLMFADGLLFRPDSQLARLIGHNFNGPPPLVYGLTRKGKRLLAQRRGEATHRISGNFRPGTAPNLSHTLAVADCMLPFHIAAARSNQLAIRDHADLLPELPVNTQKAHRPFALPVSFTHTSVAKRKNGDVAKTTNSIDIFAVPDRVFTLDELSTNTRHVFALEYESGANTINAKSLATVSWRRKVLAYFNVHLQGIHQSRWGVQRMRVLCVTPNNSMRIDKMIETQREATGSRLAGLFLYTSLEQLSTLGPLAPIWRSADADNVSLIANRSEE